MAAMELTLPKGIAPVNTCIDTKYGQKELYTRRSSTTHLDHDHRESKDVRLLAIFPPVQDLWRSPPQSVTTLKREAPL